MRKKALFLHIQTTAGTSIQVMARRGYRKNNVISHADYVKIGLDASKAYAFVSGHFGFAFARSLMNDRYSFTFLRNPVDRLLSLYSFCAATDVDHRLYHTAQQQGLDAFLALAEQEEDFRQRLWNHQVWQLAWGWGGRLAGSRDYKTTHFPPDELLDMAKTNLARFNYVGFVESFDQDAPRIFKDMGCGATEILNNNKSRSRPRLDHLSAKTRDLLQELTLLDQALYETAREYRRCKSRSMPESIGRLKPPISS
jgi:hypothetical protein